MMLAIFFAIKIFKSCSIRKLLVSLLRMRRVITYGGYFEAFMKTLSPEQRKKVNYGLLLLKSIVLFNGFHKKTQKTPRSEIEKAKRIKQEYYARTRK